MARLLLAILMCLPWATLQAAHTQARLVLGHETATPGATVLAGIHLSMDPGWHTYWKNPGASGMATSIEWDLPTGVTAGEILWPVPHKLPAEDLTTYVYEREVVLLVPLQLSDNLKPGELTLKADVAWLECEVQCLPGDAKVEAKLTIAGQSSPSKEIELLQAWQKRLPVSGEPLSPRAHWAGGAKGDLRTLEIGWTPTEAPGKIDFFPYAADSFEVLPETKTLSAERGKARLQTEVRKLEGDWPSKVEGLLIQETSGEPTGYYVEMATVRAGTTPAAGAPALPTARSLWKMLLYAFIGGLILNIMPCVLPVIALKILGFVGQAREEPGRVRKLGLVYGLGVLVSFLLLAALVIGVKAAGKQAGWGMQFGNPQFLVVLTVLVTLVALNLFGLFEITPGAKVMDTAGNLASRKGAAGAFFNGVLATVLATPCTAPFLGAALGFAFVQPTGLILLFFSVVALGLAAPYIVLSWHPGWLKFVPKPGPWMERFKVLMGFPMLATAIWIFSLLPAHYGPRSWWLAFFLVILALAVWIYGEFVQRARARPGLAAAITVGLLLAGFGYAVEGQLQWRSPPELTGATGALAAAKEDGIDWQPWSPEAVAEARAQGRPVFVDFTADWCLTCKANYKLAINVPSVRAKLKEINAVPLLGDYTRLPPVITQELKRFGRAGVPLVLVYPRNQNSEPIVLPEALTPGLVLSALERAAAPPTS